jgi:hypothetical protein
MRYHLFSSRAVGSALIAILASEGTRAIDARHGAQIVPQTL